MKSLNQKLNLQQRILKLKKKLQKNPKINALLVNHPPNLCYLTGISLFSSDSLNARIILTSKENLLFASPLISEQVSKTLSQGWKTIPRSLFLSKNNLIKDKKIRLGFEKKYILLKEFQLLKKRLAGQLVATKNLVENLRLTKDDGEMMMLKKAVNLTQEAFQFIKLKLKPDQSEKQVSWLMEKYIKNRGADLAFPIIVASGPNSSIPHYQTGSRKLKKNDLVLIDAGVKYKGYCADMSRTFFLGKPKPEWRKVHKIVKTSQDKCFNYLTANQKKLIKANDLDRVARNYIKSQGYGKYFIHNLGHGIGLNIHEKPHISPRSKMILKPNMVFTLEPGIYLAGKFGIRIEDTVIGFEASSLTKS